VKEFKGQKREDWEIEALSRLKKGGRVGARAVKYVAKHKVKLGFAKQATGAKWTVQGMLIGPRVIELSSKQAPGVRSVKDAWTISLIAHEAKHYEQGLTTALSVYGELEAWQLQMKVLRELKAPPTHPALLAIEKLKLSHKVAVLKEAARLMKKYDPAYRIDLLPLNPVGLKTIMGSLQKLVRAKGSPTSQGSPTSKVKQKKPAKAGFFVW
jgi:hypothetical protein